MSPLLSSHQSTQPFVQVAVHPTYLHFTRITHLSTSPYHVPIYIQRETTMEGSLSVYSLLLLSLSIPLSLWLSISQTRHLSNSLSPFINPPIQPPIRQTSHPMTCLHSIHMYPHLLIILVHLATSAWQSLSLSIYLFNWSLCLTLFAKSDGSHTLTLDPNDASEKSCAQLSYSARAYQRMWLC